MTLSDIVGRLGLSFFPAVAMVIFVVIFIAAMFRVLAPSRRAELRRAAELPLAEDQNRLVPGPTAREGAGAAPPR